MNCINVNIDHCDGDGVEKSDFNEEENKNENEKKNYAHTILTPLINANRIVLN